MLDLKDKILSLLQSASVDHKVYRRSVVMTCPRCNKRGKLNMYLSSGRFICWVCSTRSGFQGRPEFALTELTGKSVSELRQYLYDNGAWETGLVITDSFHNWYDEDEIVDQEIIEPELKCFLPPPDFIELEHNLSKPGVDYLASRGIPMEVAKKYGIMYSPRDARVIFPIKSGDYWCGWQGRLIKPTKEELPDGGIIERPKSLTGPFGLKKEKTLMFNEKITGEHAVLCEGPVDALKADLIGGNVCSLGKKVSDYQLNLLKNSGIKRLYLALDPDAYIEAMDVLKKASDYLEVYDLRPPRGFSDIGEMSFEQVKKAFETAPKLNKWSLIAHFEDWYGK